MWLYSPHCTWYSKNYYMALLGNFSKLIPASQPYNLKKLIYLFTALILRTFRRLNYFVGPNNESVSLIWLYQRRRCGTWCHSPSIKICFSGSSLLGKENTFVRMRTEDISWNFFLLNIAQATAAVFNSLHSSAQQGSA